MRLSLSVLLSTSCLLALPAMAQQAPTGPTVANPANWPVAKSQGLIDPATEKFVSELLAKMSVEQKVGQMIQADIGNAKPEDLRKYPLGSILAGGNSPPLSGDDRSPRKAWIDTSRAFEK
ncbi:MAG: 1,4-beta-D-glucan glucohydrolase, partial [Sphingomonadales bacterium]